MLTHANWYFCIRYRLNADKRHSMASTKEYLDFIMEQLSETEGIAYRKMMGEYVIYYRDKVVGGIYDNRFLVKPVGAALSMMPDADMVVPYEGAKPMVLVDNVDNRDFLRNLMEAMCGELPELRQRNRKR